MSSKKRGKKRKGSPGKHNFSSDDENSIHSSSKID